MGVDMDSRTGGVELFTAPLAQQQIHNELYTPPPSHTLIHQTRLENIALTQMYNETLSPPPTQHGD